MDTRLALVREVAPGSNGGVAADLARLDWDIRPMPAELDEAIQTPAELCVVDLGRSMHDAASLLRSLAELRAVVPLLVIAEPGRAAAYERELEDLLDAWPAPAGGDRATGRRSVLRSSGVTRATWGTTLSLPTSA